MKKDIQLYQLGVPTETHRKLSMIAYKHKVKRSDLVSDFLNANMLNISTNEIDYLKSAEQYKIKVQDRKVIRANLDQNKLEEVKLRCIKNRIYVTNYMNFCITKLLENESE